MPKAWGGLENSKEGKRLEVGHSVVGKWVESGLGEFC